MGMQPDDWHMNDVMQFICGVQLLHVFGGAAQTLLHPYANMCLNMHVPESVHAR